jgi:hypothetical protein
MALDQLANIADIVGATLVVVTLVFLTLQIRQNTRAVRATTIQAAMRSDMDFSSIILQEAGVWDKVLSGAPLESGKETRIAIILYNVFMTDTESRFHQFHAGYLDAQAWNGRFSTMRELVGLPIFVSWRTSPGGRSHSLDFLAILDKARTEDRDGNE